MPIPRRPESDVKRTYKTLFKLQNYSFIEVYQIKAKYV